MDILKFNRSKSVNVFEFFLSLFEKKRFVVIYSPYKDCLIMQLHLKMKQTEKAGYSLKTRKKPIKIIF